MVYSSNNDVHVDHKDDNTSNDDNDDEDGYSSVNENCY